MAIDLIQKLNKENVKRTTTDIKVGDTVRVHTKIREGSKERIQVFEGVVLGIKNGKGVNGAFTVRKISSGVGVERVFPLHSPNVVKIEVKKRAKVRRAKLNYLKSLTGKKAKLKEQQFDSLAVNSVQDEEEVQEEITETEVKAEDVPEEEIDKDLEVNPADLEDETTTAEVSTEEVAKEEVKESAKVHKAEEEAGRQDDESNIPEEEIESGIEKAEDEDTRRQEEKS